MTTIDVHAHYLPTTLVAALERRTEYPRIIDGSGGEQIEYTPGKVRPIQEEVRDIQLILTDMDAERIDMTVLSGNMSGVDWFPARDAVAIARDVNDEMVELARDHAERLAVLAVLPLQVPDAGAAELERAVSRGAVGAMIYSNVAGSFLDETHFATVFEAAAGLDVPLYLHPTYPLPAKQLDAYALGPMVGSLVDSTGAVLRLILSGLFERHPDFKLIVAHSGSLLPQLAGRIDYVASRTPGAKGKLNVRPSEALARLYTDCVCAWPPALRSTLELLGPDHVMFGSDYPYWKRRPSLVALEAAALSDRVAEAVRGDNAKRLFKLAIAEERRPD